MEMKKILFLTAAALTLASCADKNDYYFYELPASASDCPANHIETVSFESDEMLKGIDGQLVLLGDADVAGSFAGGVYPNVYWFESLADAADMLDENGAYDGPLFSTANENVWFGHAYSTGQYGDSWGGFVVSADYGKTMPETGYPQFTVWADRGACSTSTCLVGFLSTYAGEYGTPTIELAKQPRTVCHCYLANTLLAHEYAPAAESPVATTYYYRVVIKGSLNGAETGSVVCTLAQGGLRAEDWVRVDLSSLGKVDKLTFTPESNDTGEWGINAPGYFALDELAFVADK